MVKWTYNQCLHRIEKEGVSKKKKDLQAKYLNSENFKENDKKWVLETPYDVCDEAMNDLLKAYKMNFASMNNDSRTKFKLRFKSKKQETDSIVLHSKHWKKSGVFHPTVFGKTPSKVAESLPEDLKYNCRLQKTRLGHFYLCLLLPLEIRSENQTPILFNYKDGIIALDPGVRTFQTGYSPSGLTGCGMGGK